MEKSAWQKYKENLGEARPWDFINPETVYSSEEKAEQRYSICKTCPQLINLTKQCKMCGCFMTAKTRLDNASCPLGKW